MPVTLNKQPIFTATPILATLQFDPPVPTTFRNPGIDNSTTVYIDASTYGSLITKITVTSTGVVGDRVITKVIYLGIYDAGNNYTTLYQSKIMTGINTLSSSDIVPFITFDLDGGLIIKSGQELRIAASTNRVNTSYDGDEINVVVEGGTYDQP